MAATVISLLFMALVVFQISSLSSTEDILYDERCENITIPLCRDKFYHKTTVPNFLNHRSQAEAGMEIYRYWPFVEVRCSPQLGLYLCSLYAPMCTTRKGAIPPCRSICKKAKEGCEGFMTLLGYQWPKHLECDQLPEPGSDTLCVHEENSEGQ